MEPERKLEFDAMVVGGGIAGLQAALDLADQGFQVAVIERDASIGGKMIRLSKVFPTLDCASCITTPKMAAAAHHDNITLFTDCDLKELTRNDDGLAAAVTQRPRYVDTVKCIGCRQCEYGCPVYVPDHEQGGFTLRKAIYIPFSNAIPQIATLDVENCSLCGKCAKVCPTQAVNYFQKSEDIVIRAKTAVLATGFNLTPLAQKKEYGQGALQNVITSLQMERLLAPHGPYQRVLRPSDGKEPESIAYIQCAGSRDKSLGVSYCSRVCCMYAIKQAMLLSGALPLAEITIYYMDIRAFGKGYEQFFQNAKAMGIEFVKAKVAKLAQGENQQVEVRYEAQENDGGVKTRPHDLVVLSLGMVPEWNPAGTCTVATGEDAFIRCAMPKTAPTLTTLEGVFVAGVAAGPKDIVDTIVEAGAAAMEASNYLHDLAHRNAARYQRNDNFLRATSASRGQAQASIRRVGMASEGNNEIRRRSERVGVYICHCGGNISDHVNVRRVAEEVEKLPSVKVTHTNMFMCSDPGQELIQEDIKSGKINRVVVASCAPNLHELTFRNALNRADMNQYLYEHANIREQVSWVHDGEKATRKAVTLVGAAVAKARNLEALQPIRVEARRHATVIGGGVAGLRAALDLSRRGIAVTLIEKTPFLGGQVARLDRLATNETGEMIVRQLSKAAMNRPKIEICTCTQIIRSEGYVGNFKLTLNRRPPALDGEMDVAVSRSFETFSPGSYIPFTGVYPTAVPSEAREWVLETGVIVFATGFRPYTPRKGEYGYLNHPEVITLPGLIRQMAESRLAGRRLVIGGRNIRRVAFIHCVGSRQIPGIHEPGPDGQLNEYCSRTCCSATLQAAVRVRETFPDTHVFEYYRDIRTYGRGQEEYYDRASKANVIFFRYEPEAPPIVERTTGKNYPLRVRVRDTLTFGEEVTAEVDLVVLSVGMEPSPIGELVEAMKLPVGVDRFLQEVHPKLRPVEVANTGILLAGTCQAPMDVGEACAAAQAAAAKGTSLLIKGYVELDPFVAEVRSDRCTGCGVCAEVCPSKGAIELIATADQGRTARRIRVNPALCTGCGICVPECPEKAIEVKGWTLKQYEEMVDAIVAA